MLHTCCWSVPTASNLKEERKRVSKSLRDHRVLVTGGAGFIGCAISHRLAALSERFVVVDNLHPQVHPTASRPRALHPDAELVIADVTDPATWDQVLPDLRPTAVIHLAAETGTGQSLSESSRHARVNVVGTSELMDGLSRAAVMPEHVILSSSRAVYGEGRWLRRGGESFYPGQRSHDQLSAGQWDFDDATSVPSEAGLTMPDPTSVYGATKLAQEHLLSSWTRAHGIDLTILRLQNVYGPGQSLTNSYTGIVALFSRLAAAHQPIPLYEDGNVTRDFVYIDDVADAFAAAATAPPKRTGSATGMRLVDVGSGIPTSIHELAGQLAAYYDAPEPVVQGLFRDGDVRHASCEIARAETELGWSTRWDLQRGLAALQDWIRPQLEEWSTVASASRPD